MTQQLVGITPSTRVTKRVYHTIVSENIGKNTFLMHFSEKVLSIDVVPVLAKAINDGSRDYNIGFDVALLHLPKQIQSRDNQSYTIHLQLFRK
ncbi:unnamed protein product [Arabidopsis thaliana]|uniref:Uncharacterized protein n=1 Tax=Arabidopsis thaliana TaxID=3702 RepID=A0A654EMD2_ARATH|nr:unnamed protein product [Arabidopsis thaliana]